MGRGAGNASSRNSKKKPVAKGKELTPESNDESSLCGLCCEPVKDEEDDGLYCEGSCAPVVSLLLCRSNCASI